MFLVEARVEPLQKELEERDQVLRVWRSDVDVHVAEGDGGGYSQAETSRFASTTGGG